MKEKSGIVCDRTHAVTLLFSQVRSPHGAKRNARRAASEFARGPIRLRLLQNQRDVGGLIARTARRSRSGCGQQTHVISSGGLAEGVSHRMGLVEV